MKSIEWLGDAVRFIDQTLLPADEVLITTSDPEILVQAIRSLKVRGAPLIGITAAYGIALSAIRTTGNTLDEFRTALRADVHRFAGTRPTAVNLFWALRRMEQIIESAVDIPSAKTLLEEEAVQIHDADAEACRRIGGYGEPLVPRGARVITHCNTGFLATGGEGTALAVLLEAHRNGKKIHVYIDETRPALQGARLTAWECSRLGIPSTLMTDSTAAIVMKEQHIDLVIVGADRIAANGDVANKIGTYSLAVLAHHHGIPMYVAAPATTVDPLLSDGDGMVIEERDPDEIRTFGGQCVAPQDSPVFAPAFDRTPASLISAIITDQGVFEAPYDFTGIQAR